MEVTLTPDQRDFVKLAIESGRVASEEEAVAEALRQWEERQRQQLAFLATLQDAREALARGEGRELAEETVNELAQGVKERGRKRMAAELRRPA